MAPKARSRTGIWFFAKECMDNGKVRCNSVKEAIEAVYPEWKAMVSHEKSPYERMCENWRTELKIQNNIKVEPKIKPECVDFSDIEQSTHIKDLEKFIGKLASANRGINNSENSITNQRWYFIKFQTFCKSDVNPDTQFNYKPYFVLAEVALIEYTLANGIQREYHTFIKPNKIPLGYTSQCMERSREEHQIPLHSFDKIKKSYEEIYWNIISFVNYQKETVPVFCMTSDIQETYFGLKYLHDNADPCNDFPFKKILDLETLVVNLAKHCNIDFSTGSAKDLLTSYAFDYAPKSRCDFHEDLGITHCSLGLVKKSAFLISDNICHCYDIELTTKHVPTQVAISTVTHNSGFAASSYKTSTNSLNSPRNTSGYTSGSSRENSKRYNQDSPDDDAETISNNSVSSTVNSKISNIDSRNMPSGDRRTRQLVSDKLERSSFVSSSIKTNRDKGGSIISESIDSNISSNQNQYRNAPELDLPEEDDDNDWTTVEKGGFKSRKITQCDETNSNVASSLTDMTNDSASLKNSSTRSFMGRGRHLASKR